MRIYADSSFIVSLYVQERHSGAALRQIMPIKDAGDSILLTDLTLTEATNAVYLGVFRRLLSEMEASQVLEELNSDIGAGVFRLVSPSPPMWNTARELSRAYVARIGCRSLDVLHAANALLLNAELFLTFDNRQRTLAIAAGLNAPDLLSPAHS